MEANQPTVLQATDEQIAEEVEKVVEEVAAKKKKRADKVKVQQPGILVRYDQMLAAAPECWEQKVYVLNNDREYLRDGHIYWKSYDEMMNGSGPHQYYVSSKDKACQWGFLDWNRIYGSHSGMQFFEPVDQAWAAKAIERKCAIEKVVPKHILNILKKAPENPQARSMLLAVTKKAMPESIKTFEELEAWVTDKCGPPPASLVIPDRPPKPEKAFSVELKIKRTVAGQCEYQERKEGKLTFELTAADLERYIHKYTADISLDSLAIFVTNEIETAHANDDVVMRAVEDSRTHRGHHPMRDIARSCELRGGEKAFKEKLLDYMKANMPDDPRIRSLNEQT